MRMTKINKSILFLIVVICIILSYIIIGKYYWSDTDKNYIYKIATLSKIKYIGKSVTNRVEFTYQMELEKKGRYNFPDDSSTYYESQIGKRFIVKMNDKPWVNKLFFTYHLYVNKPVPDSIREAPPGGWKELPEWAK